MVSRLGEFLGVKASPDFCADIAKATTFSNMKEADAKKEQAQHLPRVQMCRKGWSSVVCSVRMHLKMV